VAGSLRVFVRALVSAHAGEILGEHVAEEPTLFDGVVEAEAVLTPKFTPRRALRGSNRAEQPRRP
jgi:hypothetical protein